MTPAGVKSPSGIIKLKEEVKMKFPDALILEVEEYEHKD
jgi:hypothetical protein